MLAEALRVPGNVRVITYPVAIPSLTLGASSVMFQTSWFQGSMRIYTSTRPADILDHIGSTIVVS
jgi:hypothetical protein